MNESEFPPLSDYQEKLFARFWKSYKPGFCFLPIQLEGHGALPVLSAARAMMRKGILSHHEACSWGLTELGIRMALDRQARQTNSTNK